MSGNDKTSWLEGLEHDDGADLGDLNNATDFTENLSGWAGKTQGSFSEGKTEFMNADARDKTQIDIGGLGLSEEDGHMVEDPVTGWLVVVQGPGLGNMATIGAGMNVIGRSEDERVSLPFGDALISSRDHVRIIYDDETRSFMIVPGSGKNISRLNGQIIAVPMVLENYAVIQLSKLTKVRFVAFCNSDFDWADVISGDNTASK